MTASAVTDRMLIGPLPHAWSPGGETGSFQVDGIVAEQVLRVRVRVFEPLEENTQYLLDRLGTRDIGPLGRPQVHPLPDDLPEGVAVLAFDESAEGYLTARLDLVRRAWHRDIILSTRQVPVEVVDELYDAMIDLLKTIRPERSDQ